MSTKGYSNGNHLHENMGSEDALRRIRTAGSISISPELFEKLYLSPQNQVKGDLRKTFGNPTPLYVSGFIITRTPTDNLIIVLSSAFSSLSRHFPATSWAGEELVETVLLVPVLTTSSADFS